MFVNKNDALQIKSIFADNDYKQQMLTKILANENYQYDRIEGFKVGQKCFVKSWKLLKNKLISKWKNRRTNKIKNNNGELESFPTSQCDSTWWSFVKNILEVVLFMFLCFKWLVKKYFVTEILLAVWETLFCEHNCNFHC